MAFVNELKAVQDLLTETLDPKKILNKKLTARELTQKDKFASSAILKARKNIEKIAFGFRKLKLQQLYIRKYQRAIIRCKDYITECLMPVEASSLQKNETNCNLGK